MTLAAPLIRVASGLLLTLLCMNVAWGQDRSHTPLPSVELPPGLERVLRDFEVAWIDKDAAGLAILFAEDGFVMPASKPPIRGRVNIEKYFVGHGGPLVLRALAYAIEGNVAYIIGGYARTKDAVDVGKYTLTLIKNEENRWMIMSDMDNDNLKH